MSKKAILLGGFAGLNTGTIKDCYSAARLHNSSAPISGFCAENKGILRSVMFRGRLRGRKLKQSGLCNIQRGELTHSFWLLKKQNKKDTYTDGSLSLAPAALKEDTLPDVLTHWSIGDIWHLEDGELQLFATPSSSLGSLSFSSVTELSTKQDLLNFMQSVNSGSADPNTLYRLTSDIDLGGKKWTPIGSDMHTPFAYHFDGNGHTIQNFCINASSHPYAGFFGYISKNATICNLTIDCEITGSGSYAGALCGENHGRIHGCIARVKAAPSRYTGAFIGHNAGEITQSCALGSILPAILPIFRWAPFLALILLTGLLCFSFYLNMQKDTPEIFAPIIVDPNAEPFDDPTLKPDPDSTSTTNATFIMNAEMTVSSSNYAGKIQLRCPKWSQRGFVATIRATQKDLAGKGIQVSDEFTTVYKSGLIKPGYGVDVITLSALPDGTKLPAGTYEFSVKFEFYNTKTNEKSAVDAVAPLDVVIN